MPDPEKPAPPANAAPTVRSEILLVAGVSAFLMLLVGMETWDALSTGSEKSSPGYALIMTLVNSFGNAMWINMDRRRRGREIGPWRWAAVLFGPAATLIYLIIEYKERAMFFVPILVAVYLAIGLLPYFAVILLRRAWA